jgi:hypothetical protein
VVPDSRSTFLMEKISALEVVNQMAWRVNELTEAIEDRTDCVSRFLLSVWADLGRVASCGNFRSGKGENRDGSKGIWEPAASMAQLRRRYRFARSGDWAFSGRVSSALGTRTCPGTLLPALEGGRELNEELPAGGESSEVDDLLAGVEVNALDPEDKDGCGPPAFSARRLPRR